MNLSEAPPDWKHRRLGEVLHIKHGYAFKGQYFSDNGPYIVLTPGNFLEEGGFKYKSKEKYYLGDFPPEYLLNRDDLLVAMTEQAEGLLGSTLLVPQDGLFLHNQRLGLISQLDTKETDLRFLYYLFNTWKVRAQIRATASGTKVRHTSPSRIYEVQVCLPPLPTQHRIAAILSAYDDLIENNTRRIALLEELAQLLYREWFVRYRFPGHEDVGMVESELGRIPEGWDTCRFSQIAEIQRIGINPQEHQSETFAHYSLPAFDQYGMPNLEKGETIRSNKYTVSSNCALLSKLNPHIPRVWLPFLDSEHRAIASTEFLVLVPHKPISRHYLFSMCCSPAFLDQFAKLAVGTSTSHQRVKPDSLLDLEIAVPRAELISEYTNLVSPTLQLAHNLRKKNAELRKMRVLLLPRLVSGEIDVSEMQVSGLET